MMEASGVREPIRREAPPGTGAPHRSRDRLRVPDAYDRYVWDTPKSAALFTAIIVLALALARLLAPLIDLQPG